MSPDVSEALSSSLLFSPRVLRAGYMPVGNDTELFFWFVESQRAPSTDPVVVGHTAPHHHDAPSP